MPQVCPTCNSALDPTHAPVARVRSAKVVTYCSVQCASQMDTGAVAAPQASEPKKASAPAPALEAKPESSPAAPELPQPAIPKPAAHRSAAREATQQDSLSTRSRQRTTILLASAAIMLGGVAFLVVPGLLQGRTDSGAALQTAPPRATNPPSERHRDTDTETAAKQNDPAPSLPSAAVLRSAAIRELESHLQDESRRFQRLAGIALARIQHPDAVARLGELLSSEPSDLSRIDIAYGMALGGDPKGREYLVGELKSSRRDARIDAARRLVQLGDDAGRKTLVQMLSVKSHRIGAASELAMLGDEAGLAVLRKELAEKDTTDENRMRAAVGLGRAGDQSARELLLTILQEGRFVVDAAGALAVLGEVQAVPALERQLELSAMRVGAAESLQSMGVEVDLASTASALTHSNEEGRIAAAEAIIILTRAEGG